MDPHEVLGALKQDGPCTVMCRVQPITLVPNGFIFCLEVCFVCIAYDIKYDSSGGSRSLLNQVVVLKWCLHCIILYDNCETSIVHQ